MNANKYHPGLDTIGNKYQFRISDIKILKTYQYGTFWNKPIQKPVQQN